MNDHPEKTALYVNPKLTVEAMQNLKAALVTMFPEDRFPQEYRKKALETLGALTSRDLIFYLLGTCVGIEEAEKALCEQFARRREDA